MIHTTIRHNRFIYVDDWMNVTKLNVPYDENINIGDWSVSADRLMTSGASTCIVLAAHNDSEKQGLMGHFTAISEPKSVDNSSQSFVDALHAVKDIGDPGETTIWVGGGMPFAEIGRASCRERVCEEV